MIKRISKSESKDELTPYNITYMGYKIQDIKKVRGIKEVSLAEFARLIEVPKPKSTDQKNKFIKFISQAYYAEQISPYKWKITKMDKNKQRNRNKKEITKLKKEQKEKDKLNNS